MGVHVSIYEYTAYSVWWILLYATFSTNSLYDQLNKTFLF